MKDLLTVSAAADRLGVAYSTLKQWIYDGAIENWGDLVTAAKHPAGCARS